MWNLKCAAVHGARLQWKNKLPCDKLIELDNSDESSDDVSSNKNNKKQRRPFDDILMDELKDYPHKNAWEIFNLSNAFDASCQCHIKH